MSTASKGAKGNDGGGFSEAERTSMKERAAEVKAERKRGRKADKAAAAKRAMLDKIASMPEPDRALAERVHAVVTAAAPDLEPKLWYGQPAWNKDGKVVCFFRSGLMDKSRYSVFGFDVAANLDDPEGLWPTSFALTELTAEGERTITDLVTRAVA